MINNIQALRALAAINVVLFHIIGSSESYSQGTGKLRYLEGWGANGVDIFFVISGFVMLHTQMLQRRSPYEFLKNRIIRIVPIYWIITLFVLFLYVLLPSLFREMALTPTWTLSSLFFTSTIFTNNSPILHVGWTLEWEMFFYLMFACGLFFRSWHLQAGFVALTIAMACTMSNNFIAIEFLLGMLVAYIYKKFRFGSAEGTVATAFGVALLLLSISSKVSELKLDRFIVWGFPSFFVVLGLLYCPQIKGRTIKYLGDASYSIYLVQVLTIPAFYKLSANFLSGLNGDIIAMLCLLSSICFGCMAYSLVEKPLTIKIRGLLCA